MTLPSGPLRLLVATASVSVGVGVGMGVMAAARTGYAQPRVSPDPVADHPLHVEYRAFPGCPNVERFFADVRLRVRGARPSRPGEPAPRQTVSLWADGDKVTGRLSIDRADGPPLSRDVSADRCDEAVAALAFIVALSLEPDASSTEPPSATARPAPTRTETSRPAWSALAGGQSSLAIASSASFGAFLGVELARTLGPLDPSFRVSASFLTGGTAAVGPLEASFRSLSFRLDGCPSSARLSIVRLSPCAGLELGSLRAEGRGLDRPVDEARFWSAAHLLGRARLEATPRLFLELELGAVVPLTARRFLVDRPPVEVFATPPIAPAGAIGVGASFP